MKVRRFLAGVLAAAMLLAGGALPAAGAAPSAFPDVTDPQTAQAVELLRLLGIVNGSGGGLYTPGGTLTRAEFCKLAIESMGKGGEAATQMNRTIFLDVKGDHWARGYINLAASTPVGDGEDKLMMGKGDGTFGPADVVTYAQSVTILMRILGYGAKDVATGNTWYDGYLATASAIGLTRGVELAGNDTVTRAQAALLFENMLFTPSNGGSDPFLSTLGVKILPQVVISSVKATASDGTPGGVQVISGGESSTYKTDHAPFDEALCGQCADLVLDKGNKVIAIRPLTGGSRREISLAEAEAGWFTTSSGERILLSGDTTVYRGGVQKTWREVYLDLKRGTVLTLYYNGAGRLGYIFLSGGSDSTESGVAYTVGSGNPFAFLTGERTDFRVVKNGSSASLSDIRQYDTGVWDSVSGTLYVSDLRLTGIYEGVAPSPASPETVTVLGTCLAVLPSAYDDMAGFKLGETVTLLLTGEGKVAGAVKPEKAWSTTVGVVTECSQTQASVRPLADIKGADGTAVILSGSVKLTADQVTAFQGKLVTVSSGKMGTITISPLKETGSTADLDVAGRRLGERSLSDNVFLYERAAGGAVGSRISFSQLTQDRVKASQICYVGTDYAGRVDVLVLEDVTGDLYTYGLARRSTVTVEYEYDVLAVEAAGSLATDWVLSASEVKEGDYIGLIASRESAEGGKRLGGLVELNKITGVDRADFTLYEDREEGGTSPIGTVSVNGQTYPIAGNVVCYHRATKSWFSGLNAARAYANTLSICFDRSPQEGGKVRVVVVE